MIASEKLIKAAAGVGGDTGDDDFANVVLLLDGDGTSGDDNNTFTDSDGSYSVTKTSTVTQGSFSPYGDNWSNYFDGSGDYLDYGSNAGFQFGSGDFTIETWFYATEASASTDYHIISYATNSTNFWAIRLRNAGDRGLEFRWFEGSEQVAIYQGSDFTDINSWHHVAVTRSGNSWRMFLDGTQVGSTVTNSGSITGFTNLQIADLDGLGFEFKGYISNARLVKGTAVYTSNFTPSTSPLTAITNTSFLGCQSNQFKDSSTTDASATVAGTPKVTPFSPFKDDDARDITTDGGSAEVSDSSSYLSMNVNLPVKFGTGNFTIEGWFYPNNLSQSYNTILDYDAGAGTNNAWWVIHFGSNGNIQWANNSALKLTGSSGSIKVGQWQHVAVVRNSGTVTIYVNGSSVGSASDTSNLTDTTSRSLRIFSQPAVGGRWFNGYMSDVRIAKSALYTSTFTPPTSPLGTATNGELLLNFQDAGIYDKTGIHNLNTIGNTQLDTAVVKYGSGSMQFDGSGDYLEGDSTLAHYFHINNSDFTAEFWVNGSMAGTTVGLASGTVGSAANSNWWLETVSGTMKLYISNGSSYTVISDTVSFSSYSGWVHVAFVNHNGTSALYMNGSRKATATTPTTNNASCPLWIGGTSSGYNVNGYMDDVRITKGVARYTGSSFTPPTAELPKF